MNPTALLSEYEIFVGIDVDAKSYAVTYQDLNKEGRSFKMPSDPQQQVLVINLIPTGSTRRN